MPIANNPRDRAVEAPRRASRLALMGAAAAFALSAAHRSGAAERRPMPKRRFQDRSLPPRPASFADIVERVKPAVVAIKVKASMIRRAAASSRCPTCRPTTRCIAFSSASEKAGQGRPQKHMTMSQGSGFVDQP